MIHARQPVTITRGIRYSTRGTRRAQTLRRMKLAALFYVVQGIATAGAIRTAQRLEAIPGTSSARDRLQAQLDAMADTFANAPVILAQWAGFCFLAGLGILVCLAEFRHGGNRKAGTRGILAGLALAAFSILWPLFL